MDKDRFDALLQLAEFRRAVRATRQQHEWQLSFALWALLVGAAVALQGQSGPWLIIAGVAIFVLHALWVGWNCYRANSDAHLMYKLFDQAMAELCPEKAGGIRIYPKPKPLGFFWHPPAFFQLVVTIALLVGDWIVLHLPPIPAN